MERLIQDFRYAFRQLRRSPGYSLTAILTLALGIGSTTAIFTLIHAILLRNLPVADPDRIYRVGSAPNAGSTSALQGNWGIFSHELYQYFRDNTPELAELAAFQSDTRRLATRRPGSSEPSEIHNGQLVSGNYFSLFGVGAAAGRVLTAEDDRPGAAPVAVLSYNAWQARYSLDPHVVGSTLEFNGVPFTIVGVGARGFFGDTLRPNPAEVWLPLSTEPAVNSASPLLNQPVMHWLNVMGRLRDGADRRGVEARLRVELTQWLTRNLDRLFGATRVQIAQQNLDVVPGGAGVASVRSMRNTYADALRLLLYASGAVLLIVCANLASLALVRGVERGRQVAVNAALGATRGRLMFQALAESLMLGIVGGALGLAVAYGGTRLLLSAAFPDSAEIPVNAMPALPVLGFALGVALATGVLFGLMPAWIASRIDPVLAFRGALRGAGRSTRTSGGWQRGLVVAQTALSLVLLSVAGLLAGSLRNLEKQQLGFAGDGRVAVRIDPQTAGYKPAQLDALYRSMRERLLRISGVQRVSFALYSPMSGSYWSGAVWVAGHDEQQPSDGRTLAAANRVGADYFGIVGTRVLRGRGIDERDTPASRPVAVVNESFSRRYFPGGDAVGGHFGRGGPKSTGAYEIVGVVEDTKYRQPEEPAPAMYFMAAGQLVLTGNPTEESWELRSQYLTDVVMEVSGTGSYEAQVRRAVAAVDPNLPVVRVASFTTLLSRTLNQQSLIAELTGLFAAAALLLASIGLYGVTSYRAEMRTREVGVRVALGATRSEIAALFVRSGFSLVAIGLVLGIPAAVAVGRYLENRLFGIRGADPSVLTGAVVVLAICALAAVIVPARRASGVDPSEALRAD